MKYWLFDGSDVVGPFQPQELAVRSGFAATSLVCPENFSEDQDSWKPASCYDDFSFSEEGEPLLEKEEVLEKTSPSFEEEMDTLLKNDPDPLARPAETPSMGSSLQIPKKPAKPGPIEEYFNNINGEDLGDILGIPDPNEISDLNLARVLEDQFSKTNPPTDREIELVEGDPFEEFTTDTPEQTFSSNQLPPVEKTPTDEPSLEASSITNSESLSQKDSIPISEETDEPILPLQEPVSETPVPQTEQASSSEAVLPVLAEETSAESKETTEAILPINSVPTPQEAPDTCSLPRLTEQTPETLPTLPDMEPAPQNEGISLAEQVKNEEVPPEVTAAQDFQQEETTVSDVPTPSQEKVSDNPDPNEDTVRDILEGELEVPLQQETEEPIKRITPIPEVSQIKSHLNQTPEMEEFITSHSLKARPSYKKARAVLSLLIALLVVGAAWWFNQISQEEGALPANPSPQQASAAQGDESSSLSMEDTPLPAPPPAPLTLEDKALAAVQNFQLSGDKGTIASYFDRIYQDKITQGYTASWAAEPLHKNTYIVKYRLTKTRMEPIVYVFQADAANGRLTGALNNVAIDLVGKI